MKVSGWVCLYSSLILLLCSFPPFHGTGLAVEEYIMDEGR